MTTPLDLIEAHAARQPDADAIVYLPDPKSDEDVTLTYKDLAEQVRAAANAFLANGVKRGDVIGLLLLTTPEAMVALFAAMSVGRAFPMNILLSADALTAQLREANVQHMITMGDMASLPLASKVQETAHPFGVIAELPIPGATCLHTPWRDLLDNAPTLETLTLNRPTDIAAMFTTGGTTGKPKIALLSCRAIMDGSAAIVAGGGHESDDRMLSGFPLFHVGGTIAVGLAALQVGSAVVMASALGARHPDFLPSIWSIVERQRITALGMVPTLLSMMTTIPVGDHDISSLRSLNTGGAKTPEDVIRQVEAQAKVQLHDLYGMTEVAAAATTDMRGQSVLGSAGKPLPGVQIAVGSPDAPLAQGDVGEVHIKGPGNFNGYLGQDDAEDGPPVEWVATGDLGYLSDTGHLFITGRSKDLIIRSGHNIDPSVIEEVAQTHPSVALAAAVAYPDDYAGEIPALFVELKEGETATPDAIKAYVTERVNEPPAKPRHVFLIDQMPLTTVGKIFKPELRERAKAIASEKAPSNQS